MREDRGISLVQVLIVVVVVGLIAAFAVNRFVEAREAGDESSALATLRALAGAESLFARSCGHGGYAMTLATLATPPPGSTVGFVSTELASSATPTRDGYAFMLAPGPGTAAGPADCFNHPTSTTFYATATPLPSGITGSHSFAVNGDETIWEAPAGPAPTLPFGPPAVEVR